MPEEAGDPIENGPVVQQGRPDGSDGQDRDRDGHAAATAGPIGQATKAGAGPECGREGEPAITTKRKPTATPVLAAGAAGHDPATVQFGDGQRDPRRRRWRRSDG